MVNMISGVQKLVRCQAQYQAFTRPLVFQMTATCSRSSAAASSAWRRPSPSWTSTTPSRPLVPTGLKTGTRQIPRQRKCWHQGNCSEQFGIMTSQIALKVASYSRTHWVYYKVVVGNRFEVPEGWGAPVRGRSIKEIRPKQTVGTVLCSGSSSGVEHTLSNMSS